MKYLKNIIVPIENHDNGGAINPLSVFISSYLLNYDDEKSMNEVFIEVEKEIVGFIKRQVKKNKSF